MAEETRRPVIRNRKLEDPDAVWNHNSWYQQLNFRSFIFSKG